MSYKEKDICSFLSNLFKYHFTICSLVQFQDIRWKFLQVCLFWESPASYTAILITNHSVFALNFVMSYELVCLYKNLENNML